MTSRRQLEAHRRRLGEIRDIMNAMKNLAYLETRKLERFLDAQSAVVNGIQTVAADFVSAYPGTMPEAATAGAVHLLIGSERGFCGDFNEALLRHLETESEQHRAPDFSILIATGRKLHDSLINDPRVSALLDGAGVVEEVEAVLTHVVDTLAALQARYGALALYVLYHVDDEHGIVVQQLLPPFQKYRHKPAVDPLPPLLNLAPAEFLIELSDHYLFAALHEVLYTSLMAENRRRVLHLEGAVKHLDEEADRLRRRFNARRQEEIIEEIEVILLSAASLEKTSPKRE